MSHTATLAFGPLLKQLRKQAGMTQRDLAAALGYSESLISCLEKAYRQPDLQAVTTRFIAALGLQDDPRTAASLIEQAALARGERPPIAVTFQRTTQTVLQAERTVENQSLSSPPTELIGRSVEVNHLCNRLLGHSGRLLTLLGPPGIGKTTLALAVAARLQHDYDDGVVVVPLAAISDPALMAATILATVGSTDIHPPQNKLIAFLHRKSMLLVLDNLEQISEAAPLIANLVAECPYLCILATSRERLHLRAEQRYKVPPLALTAAVELFVQRAQVVDADFSRTAHNQPTLEAICQRLDCLPLAIELCAAQIDILSPTQLLTQLQAHRLDLLVDGAHDLPPRQRTLRTAIDYSYRLLDEAERLLLRTLGVFAGGFALDAAEALAVDRLEPAVVHTTLHVLIGKSLVRAETLPNGAQRFLLLETIREFALEQLRAQGEDAMLRQRHYAAYLQLMRIGDRQIRGPESTTWFNCLETELDNSRTALQWTLDEKHYADMAWLVVALHWFWGWRGHSYEGLRWLGQLLPHRQGLETNLRLATFVSFYSVARAIEDFQPLHHYWDEFLALLEGCTDNLLGSAGWHFVAIYAPDFSQTIAAHERSVALARAANEAPGLGSEFCLFTDGSFILVSVLWGYAVFLLVSGEVARAAPLATESLTLHRARGNRFEIANGLGAVGLLALLQNDLTQAQQHLQEAVTIATAFTLPDILGNWQPLLGIVTFYLGEPVEARRLLIEGLRICLDLKDKRLLARVYTYLTDLALWEGLLDEAAQWLAQSLIYYDPGRVSIYEVGRLFVAARLATAHQQYQRAATFFGLAEQAHSQIHHALAGPMRALAEAALAIVQAALEPAVFADAFAAGQQMALAEAFATMLTPRPIAGLPTTV